MNIVCKKDGEIAVRDWIQLPSMDEKYYLGYSFCPVCHKTTKDHPDNFESIATAKREA